MKSAQKNVKTALIAAAIGAAVSLILAIIKTSVGLSTNSVCIMLDGANSYMDIVSGIAAVVAFAFLLKPKTDNAPFGYGKGEYLAGLMTTIMCLVFGGIFLVESINRLAMPQPVWFGLQSTLLIVAAFVIKLGLVVFYFFINKKIKFKAIAALCLDSVLDLGVTAASLVSLAVSSKISFAADAYFGIVVSIAVIASAIKCSGQNLKSLLGVNAKVYAEHLSEINEICKQYGVVAKDVVLHDYGYSGVYGTLELEPLSEVKVDVEQASKDVQEALSKKSFHLNIVPKANNGENRTD